VNKNQYEIIVGASILAALLILIGGVLWLKEVNVTRKAVNYSVLFPNIGTLQKGDPVTANGVKVGAVSSIEFHQAQVAVGIEIDQSVSLTDSARIIVQNIGLMGERMVGIQLSPKGTPIAPNESDSPKHYIQGYFDSGIAEAMGMLGAVLVEVEDLIVNVNEVFAQTVGDTDFVNFFNVVQSRIDTITEDVSALIDNNASSLQKTVRDASAVAQQLRMVLQQNKTRIDTIFASGQSVAVKTEKIVTEVDSISQSVQQIVSSIERGEGSLGLLLEDEEFYREMKQTVGRIDSLVDDVSERGLKLRIRLGF